MPVRFRCSATNKTCLKQGRFCNFKAGSRKQPRNRSGVNAEQVRGRGSRDAAVSERSRSGESGQEVRERRAIPVLGNKKRGCPISIHGRVIAYGGGASIKPQCRNARYHYMWWFRLSSTTLRVLLGQPLCNFKAGSRKQARNRRACAYSKSSAFAV